MNKIATETDPTFPLTKHSRGYYVKVILGKMHYFGKRNGSALKALQDYEFKRPYLEEGLDPPKQGGMSLLEALDKFLIAKEKRIKSGELTPRSFDDYKAICTKILTVFNGGRSVNGLLPTDFGRLRESFKGTPITIGNRINRSKVVFNWIEKNFNVKVAYGDQFDKPNRLSVRKHRNAQPKRLFYPNELRFILNAARPNMRAMVLLGINCGLGNSDCGTIEIAKVDLAQGWHNYARPKTGVERRAKLWPETVEALQTVIGDRTEGLVFITRHGNPWSLDTRANPISCEFRKLADSVGSQRTFYDLRRTFQTIGDNSKDPVAVKHAMGHSDGSMSETYRQLVPDDRLEAVSDVVRRWLGI
jgi:integrase